jgi:hypothetical protein
MSEFVYLLTIGLFFGTILIVFAMKYFAVARQSQSRIANEDAFRELAQEGVAAQTQNATALAALQAEFSLFNTRLAAVEKILKAVE